ncbi:MAG: hypothetical protein MOB07_26165 [Acidobacteria bacterium]|nr:hypothetical protein [Acidobacteriota bacterium]
MDQEKEFQTLKWLAFPGVGALLTAGVVIKQAERLAGADLAILIIFALLAVISSLITCRLMGQLRKHYLLGFLGQIALTAGTFAAFTIAFYPK